MVSIIGVCRDEGKPTAQASWGVFFGPDSPFNSSGRLSPSLPQTSFHAEFEALSQALDALPAIRAADPTYNNSDPPGMEVKFRSDSEYLCQAMSMWIRGWMSAGGVRPDGQPITHYDELKQLNTKMMRFGVRVFFQFWHVPREKNLEAEALANEALDG